MADKVLIHSQGRSVGALKEAIDHYRPSMVFLISNPDTNAGKMKSWIDQGDSRAGNWSKDVEHCEIININPFDEETVLQVIMAVQEAITKAHQRSKHGNLEFYGSNWRYKSNGYWNGFNDHSKRFENVLDIGC